MLFLFFSSTVSAQIGVPCIDGNSTEWDGSTVIEQATFELRHDTFIGNEDDIFTSGKDFKAWGDYSPTPDYSTWTYSPMQAKSDIMNGAAVIFTGITGAPGCTSDFGAYDSNHTYLFFAGDRESNNGTGYIGFWFLLGGSQATIDADGNKIFSPNHYTNFGEPKPEGGTYGLEDCVGDLLLLADFTGGGRDAAVTVFKWVGKGNGTVGGNKQADRSFFPIGTASQVGQNNAEMVDVPSNFIVPTGQIKYDYNEFYEGVIDITEVFNLTDNPQQLLCSATWMLETRSSAELTADSKDFVGGSFNIAPTIQASSTTVCAGDMGSLTATLYDANNDEVSPDGYTFEWYKEADWNDGMPDSANDVGDGSNILSFEAAGPSDIGTYYVIATSETECTPTGFGTGVFGIRVPPNVQSAPIFSYCTDEITAPDDETTLDNFKTNLVTLLEELKVLLENNDLTFADLNFEWFKDVNREELITKFGDLVGGLTLNTDNVVYAKVRSTEPDACFAPFQFTVRLNTPPAPEFGPLTLCEEGGSTGTASFNLNNGINAGGDLGVDETASFFLSLEDAENNENAIGSPESYVSGNDEIFARVDNTSSNCFAIGSFTLTVLEAITISCPEDDGVVACTSQEDLNTAFNDWKALFTYQVGDTQESVMYSINGEDPIGSLDEIMAPDICGGEITIEIIASDECVVDGLTCSATFTVDSAPDLTIDTPANKTVSACDGDIAAQWDAFVAAFSVSGGCSPSGAFEVTPAMPDVCGGSIELNYQVSDVCYAGSDNKATFTITAAPDLTIDTPANKTVSACDGDIAAQWDAFVAAFSVSGGCSPSGAFEVTPAMPDVCGGSIELNYQVSDVCYAGSDNKATFTITAAPDLTIDTPANKTVSACDGDIAAQWDAFVAAFSVSGGCSPSGAFEVTPAMPDVCGGSIELNYQVSDVCYAGSDNKATFTITAAPDLTIDTPANKTVSACDGDIAAQWDAFVAAFSVSGGCSPSGAFEVTPAMPDVCGGSIELNYQVSDVCYAGSDNKATFTITAAPDLTIDTPANKTVSACDGDIAAQWDAFVAAFSVSGGCSPSGAFEVTPAMPDVCGGSIELNYQVSDVCYAGSDNKATFTITAAPDLTIDTPANKTVSACDGDIAAQWDAFVAAFSVSGGCSPSGAFEVTPAMPDVCGGSIELNYQVSDVCYAGSDNKATFTITAAPDLTIDTPANKTVSACDGDIAAQWDAFVAAFSVSGGCSPSGAFEVTPAMPDVCGGSIELNYQVSDVCYAGSDNKATFTITAAPDLTIDTPANKTVSACDGDIAAQWDAFVAAFSVSGGCSPSGAFEVTPAMPDVCGGSIELNYQVSDVCYAGSDNKATFTITAAPDLTIDTPANKTVSACDGDIAAQWDAFVAAFSVSGGCSPSGAFEVTPAMPDVCGGSIELNYQVSDVCYAGSDNKATFTITAAPDLTIDTPANKTVSACDGDIAAQWDAFVAAFSVSGGCSPSGAFEVTPAMPDVCGGSIELNYQVSDVCYAGSDNKATFTITAAPDLTIDTPANKTVSACDGDIAAQWDAFVAAFSVSGGCSPSGAFEVTPAMPDVCGGSIELNYQVSDVCYAGSDNKATFTITAAPDLTIDTPANKTVSACDGDIAAQWDAFVAAFSVSGGCSPSGAFEVTPAMPDVCGGSIELNYQVSDVCYAGSDNKATFTITAAPDLTIDTPANKTVSACDGDIAAQWDAFVAAFSVSGGCSPSGAFEVTPAMPDVCGGSIELNYQVSDVCYAGSDNKATFTITAAPDLTIDTPANKTVSACDGDIAAQWDAFVAAFSVSGGCSPSGAFEVTPAMPDVCGGSIELNYQVSDVCYAGSDNKATFTITAAPDLTIDTPANKTVSACDGDIAAQWDAFVAAFSVSGGCSPSGAFEVTPAMPDVCGGSIELNYQVSDVCYAGSDNKATFTITAAPDLTIDTPANKTVSACDGDIAAQWDAFVAAFSVSGGCSPSGAFEVTPAMPDVCGGSIELNYQVSDVCYAGSDNKATFTITAAPDLTIDTPANKTVSACDGDIAAQWDAFVAAFSVSGGCSPSGAFEVTPAMPDVCGGSIELNYQVSDVCYAGSDNKATFTITAAPDLTIDTPANKTVSACDGDIAAQWDAFVAAFSVSGGCSPSGAFEVTPAMPDVCGGSIELNYQVSDVCYAGSDNKATFTITAAPDLTIDTPANKTVSACDGDIAAQWDAFVAAFSVSGGCSPSGAFEVTPAMPDVCGGSIELNYQVSDVCYAGSDNKATFTITAAPDLTIDTPANKTVSACDGDIAAQWDAFVAAFSVSGGCSPSGAFEVTPAMPDVCGGSIELNYQVSDVCYAGSDNKATFTITAAPDLTIDTPANKTVSACDGDIAAQWDAFVAAFSVSGGCSPSGAFEVTPAMPDVCGGSIELNYQVSDVCYAGSDNKATFTITAAPDLTIDTPANKTVSACDGDIAAQWDAFVAAFSVSGGCSPSGAFEVTPAMPDVCGGSIELNYQVSDVCYAGSDNKATFTITAAPDLTIDTPANKTVSACDGDIAAQWDAFVAAFSVSGGCSPSGAFEVTPAMPDVCGGSIELNYQVSDVCYAGSDNKATFTITAAPDLTIDTPANKTVSACDGDIAAQWDAFVAAFSVSGGCSPSGAFEVTPAMPDVCGGSIELNYQVSDVCYAGSDNKATFTITAAPDLTIDTPANKTVSACDGDIAAQWDAFVAAFSVSGGCSPSGAFEVTPAMPDVCGGSIELNYQVSDVCYAGSDNKATFTITAAPDVVIILPDVGETTICNGAFPESLTASYTGCVPGVLTVGPTNIRYSNDGCAELADYVFTTPLDVCGNFDTKTITITREFDKYDNCETMFARNGADALCFLDDNVGEDGGDFNRWGWTNLVAPSDTDYVMDLYAGAAHCDITKGAHVGTATVSYNGSNMTVSYNLFEGYGMSEAHVYVGCDLYPTKRGEYTVAPGQYNFNPGGSYDYVEDLTIEIEDLPGTELYVIIHGVVCEEVCKCSEETSHGGTVNVSGDTNCPDSELMAKTDSTEETAYFTAYPVPYENEVTISYKFDYDTDVTIEVYDMKGALLKQTVNNSYSKGSKIETKLDLSLFDDQMLFVRITSSKGTMIKKIVSNKKQ
ncbi:T9SS type A sorting domain-containing protein [Aestuariibaculum lutulentum]|nr:T9SS type A sorting domain-containing protein [Aestuariibaculum lutulentum]